MKKGAIILLFIFGFVQVAPAFHSLFNSNTIVLMVDEDKSDTAKGGTEKNIKKDLFHYSCHHRQFTSVITTAFHLSEKIETGPIVELQTPPPDFC